MTEKERKYFERLSAKLENLILNQNCVASKGDDTMNKNRQFIKVTGLPKGQTVVGGRALQKRAYDLYLWSNRRRS